MKLTKTGYIERLIDKEIKDLLTIFGAVLIEGPKWCGKTWTSLNQSNSVVYINEQNNQELAKVDPKLIFNKNYPILIDEWQIVPKIWDAVRFECDNDNIKGKFILTGSSNIINKELNGINHSGLGRISRLKMYTMTLFEMGLSNGKASLSQLLENKLTEVSTDEIDLNEMANIIIAGGWPSNIDVKSSLKFKTPKHYLDTFIYQDINHFGNKNINPQIVSMIIKSLARNESSIVNTTTILNDVSEIQDKRDLLKNKLTVLKYLELLENSFILINTPAFSTNYRSSKKIGKSPKRNLVDPSLSCAAIGLTQDKLMSDLNTFGLMFESFVMKELRVYCQSIDANLYHFRDNSSGDEIDAIIEFNDSRYIAIEIKLTTNSIDKAKKSLWKFSQGVNKKPSAMAIIVSSAKAIYQDRETGIWIVPINSLKP